MNKKVLIIEDNDGIRENIVEILELANYTVYEGSNGNVGIELALKHLPDIILCDIMMPDLDGYGVLHMLNKLPETGAIPFIFLTAKNETRDLRKGMELGADDYLTKPFDDSVLLNAIKSRLKKKETQHDFYSKSFDRLNTLVSKSDGLDELKKIIEERKSRQFKKNQVIYYEGDKGKYIYLVISGRIKTTKFAEDGRELMMNIYSPDDYLGANAMLSNEPYSDTATALEDCLLCQIPNEQLEHLLNLYPEVARSFIKLLSNDIREKEGHLLQLAYHSVRKKMAEVLLRLSANNPAGAISKVSRENLAAMVGIASETVSRTLSDFKEEGLSKKKGSTIWLLDLECLAKMKN